MSGAVGHDTASEMRSAIDREIIRAARAEGVDVRERKLSWSSSGLTTLRAEPLAAIRYARIARGAAARAIEAYIKIAREDGLTWLQVGQALGLADDPEAGGDYDVGAAAYEYATGPARAFEQPLFYFDCPVCRKRVTDHGPYTANPFDCESGHGDGCERFSAEVARYREDWGDDE